MPRRDGATRRADHDSTHAALTGSDGAFEIEVTDVQQDQPQSAPGQGQADPDAVIGGAGFPVRVRAKRSGKGGARAHRVGFTARDAAGRECKGNVRACVPHHAGAGCGDSGPQCCAELRGFLPPDRCPLGGPAGEGEFACLRNCLALAFYSDQPLGAARLECASACSKPRPKPSAATTALLSCMLGLNGQEDSCIVQCLGAPLE
jgi:hypothetical protein